MRSRAARAGLAALGLSLLAGAAGPPARTVETSAAGPPARTVDTGAAALRQHYTQSPAAWPAAWLDPPPADAPAEVAATAAAARPAPRELAPAVAGPAPDPRQVQLGQTLFFDPSLSASGRLSCASCHQPQYGFSSGPRQPPGAPPAAPAPAARKAPGLLAARLQQPWGWDGRHGSQHAALLAPLTRPDEMANPSLPAVLSRLADDPRHGPAFAALHGPRALEADDLAQALSAYLRSLERPSDLDRFLDGEHDRLDDQQLLGLHLFRTKARCLNCHHGAALRDGRFHNLGISSFGEPAEDLGRHRISGAPQDVGAFRTPSLRHVAQAAPYMHNGRHTTLAGVINLYDRGGGEVWVRNAAEAAHPLLESARTVSPHIRPLSLSDAEKAALLAFLRAL